MTMEAISWAIAGSGFLVGTLVGVTGIGGGALMTPILVIFFGVPVSTAVGTDLLFAALTKIAGASIHGVRGTIDWQVFRRLSAGSLPAATLTGLFVLGAYDIATESARQTLMSFLGVMLLVTAVGLLVKNRLHAIGRQLRIARSDQFKRMQGPLTVLAGMILGCVVTLTSVGAGAFGAVVLLYLYPLRLTPARLVGTDIFHAIPLALVAGASHWWSGTIEWPLLFNLLLGSIPGVLLGSVWSSRAPETPLRLILAGVLALSSAKIIFY